MLKTLRAPSTPFAPVVHDEVMNAELLRWGQPRGVDAQVKVHERSAQRRRGGVRVVSARRAFRASPPRAGVFPPCPRRWRCSPRAPRADHPPALLEPDPDRATLVRDDLLHRLAEGYFAPELTHAARERVDDGLTSPTG